MDNSVLVPESPARVTPTGKPAQTGIWQDNGGSIGGAIGGRERKPLSLRQLVLDRRRFALLQALRFGERTPALLRELLPASFKNRKTLAGHLALLLGGGLVLREVEGKSSFYKLSPQGVAACQQFGVVIDV